MFEIVAHTNEIYTLDFSPFNEFLLLSGSADETASVWDLRNLTRSLSTVKSPSLNGSRSSIIKAQWSPFTSTIFATCGYGRTLDVWDLSKEKSQTQEISYMFRHGGHRSKVMDFDWNKNEKLLIGSV
jgi:histone-binding protein RBBP4